MWLQVKHQRKRAKVFSLQSLSSVNYCILLNEVIVDNMYETVCISVTTFQNISILIQVMIQVLMFARTVFFVDPYDIKLSY